MDQELLNKISFYGKIIDELHTTIDLYEKELKLEEQEPRIKACKKVITGLKSTLKHFKASQKIMAFEA